MISQDTTRRIDEDAHMAQVMSDMVYLDSGSNKMITTWRKHVKNLQQTDRQMTTANRGNLCW